MKKISEFVPTIVEPGFGLMLVRLEQCTHCKKTMLPPEPKHSSIFPGYMYAQRANQMKRAGWVERAPVTDAEHRALCVECAPEFAAFQCYSCKVTHKGEPNRSFGWGHGADYLCTPCYETVPAKKWDALVRELEDEHRYDDC